MKLIKKAKEEYSQDRSAEGTKEGKERKKDGRIEKMIMRDLKGRKIRSGTTREF